VKLIIAFLSSTFGSDGQHRSVCLLSGLFFLTGIIVGFSPFVSHFISNVGLVDWHKAAQGNGTLAVPSDLVDSSLNELLIKRMTRAIDWQFSNQSAHRMLGFAYEAQGERDAAVEAWWSAGLGAESFISWGGISHEAGHLNSALIWYDRASRLQPELSDPWNMMGHVLWEQKQWDRALASYQKAAELDYFRETDKSSTYYRIGALYHWMMDSHDLDKALSAYNVALDADTFPNDWQRAVALYGRAQVFWDQGHRDRAFVDVQAATELAPEHYGARVLLGVAYYRVFGSLNRALDELNAAVELDPQDARGFWALGSIYQNEGMLDEAQKAFEKVLELDPDNEAAQERLDELKKESRRVD